MLILNHIKPESYELAPYFAQDVQQGPFSMTNIYSCPMTTVISMSFCMKQDTIKEETNHKQKH